MKQRPSTEAELCVLAEEYLASFGFEVYKEVKMYGYICDMVGKRGPVLWAVECKMNAGLGVIQQAHRWLHCAHRVSVCVPRYGSGLKHFFTRSAATFGIGCLSVHEDWSLGRGTSYLVREDSAPQFRRKIASPIRLREEQKASVAGLPSPEAVTAFSLTVKQIKELLQKHPDGLPMKDVVSNINHHYRVDSTARGCLYRWIREGVVKGVELREGRVCLEKLTG